MKPGYNWENKEESYFVSCVVRDRQSESVALTAGWGARMVIILEEGPEIGTLVFGFGLGFEFGTFLINDG